ncbi:hypothetical protein [Chryseobacterium sp.]|uniref:structural cement protein Gp24 n=1 Tax=Chryseobacterium sp. TaxID=1871047 RepID=UPI00321B9D4F
MPFQKTVNTYSSPAADGQIASGNPTAWYVAGPGALVSGAAGLAVAAFAWATPIAAGDTPERADSNALLVAAGTSRAPSGFVVNEQQGNWTALLQESGMQILPNQAIELMTRGDVWKKTPAGVTAVRGQKVYANMLDGSVLGFGATGLNLNGTAVTASFATNVMTVTAGSNIKVGSAVIGAGVPANTFVTAQTGGTTGGAGTYTLSTTPGTIASQSNTVTDYIETRFSVLSIGQAAGDFVKIGFGD